MGWKDQTTMKLLNGTVSMNEIIHLAQVSFRLPILDIAIYHK